MQEVELMLGFHTRNTVLKADTVHLERVGCSQLSVPSKWDLHQSGGTINLCQHDVPFKWWPLGFPIQFLQLSLILVVNRN